MKVRLRLCKLSLALGRPARPAVRRCQLMVAACTQGWAGRGIDALDFACAFLLAGNRGCAGMAGWCRDVEMAGPGAKNTQRDTA